MMEVGNTIRKRVVIVGGGFAGMNAAMQLGHLPVEVTLVDRRNHHTFQPLLYQVALAVLSPAEIAQPIRSILRDFRNTEVLMDEVVGFDRSAELQADEVGALYAFRAGYDPNEIPRFLKALGGATGEVPVWLMPIADHPQSDDRVRRLQLILAGPTFRTARPLAEGRDTYRRAVIAKLGLSPELNPSPAPATP